MTHTNIHSDPEFRDLFERSRVLFRQTEQLLEAKEIDRAAFQCLAKANDELVRDSLAAVERLKLRSASTYSENTAGQFLRPEGNTPS